MTCNALTKKHKRTNKTQFGQPKKREKRLVGHRKKRQAHNRRQKQALQSFLADNLGAILLNGLNQVLRTHFADLTTRLEKLPDPRSRSSYPLSDILFAAIMLYGLKQGKRHYLNQKRKSERFRKNYERTFGRKLPHMDTVNAVLEKIPSKELENLCVELVKVLLDKRLFHSRRLLGKYFCIAVDASGYASYEQVPNWSCPYKVSKKGKKTWVQPILCAKLVLGNGFCIPILTEWILNEEEYKKQDCELKAFKRLAKRLKVHFPRLPICILTDALYSNAPFFSICQEYKWKYISVLKEGKLKDVWTEVALFDRLYAKNQKHLPQAIDHQTRKDQLFKWIDNLKYQDHTLHWISCKEEKYQTNKESSRLVQTNHFVYVTNIAVNQTNIQQLIQAGRLRWKIENEGFNEQKNGGYKLKHKISRTNLNALQNFMHCLQIGHLINQLLTLTHQFKNQIQKQFTLQHCWEQILAYLGQSTTNSEMALIEHNIYWTLRYP